MYREEYTEKASNNKAEVRKMTTTMAMQMKQIDTTYERRTKGASPLF